MSLSNNMIYAPKSLTVQVEADPVYNVISSLGFIARAEQYPGLSERLLELAEQLSHEQRFTNRVIFDGMMNIAWPSGERTWPDFPAYVDDIAQRDAEAMRDGQLDAVAAWHTELQSESMTTADLLADEDTYLHVMRSATPPEATFDEDLFRACFAWHQHPEQMQDRIVDHLREMWETIFAAEWERTRPAMEKIAAAFEEINFTGTDVYDAIERVSGRDIRGGLDLPTVKRVIFVPSEHIGPYLAFYNKPNAEPIETIRIVFQARMPTSTASLSRSDLLVRLNAIADDTRLRILELFTEHDELFAQDVITMLELSQSSASRHLRQLSATGFLNERRQEGAKCYKLNDERIQDTIQALDAFFQQK